MPRADISRCQARKSRPGIAFQTLKLSSLKEVVFRGCVLRLLYYFGVDSLFTCVMEFLSDLIVSLEITEPTYFVD
jgi:hypothetical protein